MSPPRRFVFVHGSQSDRRVWDPLIALAPPGVVVSTFDLPDHGASADVSDPDPELLRRAVVENVSALEAGRLVFVGHSLGAHLIASLAAELSERIERAVLISGFDYLHEEDERTYRAMVNGLERGRLDLELLREVALEVGLGERHRRPEHDELVTKMQEMSFERAVRSLRRGLVLGPPGVEPYTCPATVIHGRDDAAIPYARSEELAAKGSDAALVPLDTDSHVLPLTHPQELARFVFRSSAGDAPGDAS